MKLLLTSSPQMRGGMRRGGEKIYLTAPPLNPLLN